MFYGDSRYDACQQSFRFFVKSSDVEYLPVRLPNPETEIALRVPFDDARMDRLFALDLEPQPREAVMDLLELNSSKDPRLARLFTDQPVRKPEPWTGAGPRIRYLGHACALVEWRGISILVVDRPVRITVPSRGKIGIDAASESIRAVLCSTGSDMCARVKMSVTPSGAAKRRAMNVRLQTDRSHGDTPQRSNDCASVSPHQRR